MFEIVEKRVLVEEAPRVHLLMVAAPLVAAKTQPGQFVMVRLDETGERIPISISDFDAIGGTITIVVQEVGASTFQMGRMSAGDALADVLGPLGKAADIAKRGTVVCVAGGVAAAIIYPEARRHSEVGNKVISILGARSRSHLFYRQEIEACSDRVMYATDDGTEGHKGFVTELLAQVIGEEPVDEVVAIGPLPMMRAACDVSRGRRIKTVVSLNPIMVDGTGMCGACRVSVGGATRFSCTDGPEFDGHLVDFDLLISRSRQYVAAERVALEEFLRGDAGRVPGSRSGSEGCERCQER
ncbi:MAG: sulfide/dihydroorotate dehydrogenase-like FAD/NAD-binding protein [Firmicutes bacterium]|nr:sulfide/dihydroorotate dehydrogenase-like FAD/NAD-binding protein [Bacillota bacterium]